MIQTIIIPILGRHDLLERAIKALQSRGLFQSLAEPNLVAQSGKEASFLAGGEFPVPIAQGSGTATAITVQFKEFGIRHIDMPLTAEKIWRAMHAAKAA